MAKKVLSVCDVCGGPTDQGTFRFGWDLVTYEVDLCDDHAESLIETMENLIKHSRRLGARPTSTPIESPPPKPHQQATTSEVRAWAKKNRIDVSERGRIPDEVFEKYLASRRKK